jgi:hypothetical protein
MKIFSKELNRVIMDNPEVTIDYAIKFLLDGIDMEAGPAQGFIRLTDALLEIATNFTFTNDDGTHVLI